MIWIVIILLFTSLVLWVLFGPVIVYLETETNRYYLALPGIFKAMVVPAGELFRIRVWIFFIPCTFCPFGEGRGRRKAGRPKKRKGLKIPLSDIRTIKDSFRAFRIRKLHLDLDTGDFILNAWLVPAFSFINAGNIRMRVNFEGTSSLLLDLRTRLGSLLWIVIRNKYKSLFNR